MSFSKRLKEQASTIWEAGYQHPFVQEMGKGTLDRKKFQFYLLQDYQYLLQYAKVFALGVVKADQEILMTRLTDTQHIILAKEMDVHRAYMVEFGITHEQIQQVKPSLFNRTYTANMLAVGQTNGLAEILASVFPCAWTYFDYAQRLKKQYADTLEHNFYKTWIENYSSVAFRESFEWFFDALDELVQHKTKQERERIAEIFISSVEFEYLFWDMAYKQEMSYLL